MKDDKSGKTTREDIISHFICRMLYCYESSNHFKFVEMEKSILKIKLQRAKHLQARERFMYVLKEMLASFLKEKSSAFEVSEEEWNNYNHKIYRFNI